MIEPVRLNIGAGKTAIEGFTPVDRSRGDEAYPLKHANGSADEIRASHILEHFTFAEVPKVLADWVRVLKPGGKIRIAVPDLKWIGEHAEDEPGAVLYAMGGQLDENDYHKSAYTEPRLRVLMQNAGLGSIERWTSDNTDCASLPCSLNLEGVKTTEPIYQDIKIAACISIPRLGWNDHWGCVIDALAQFRIPIRRYTGAFWGQCLQRVMSGAVEDGLDWILTLDYDTMFTAKDVNTLIGEFGQNPAIDALAGLQVRRDAPSALMTKRGSKKCEVTGKPIKVDTAHFGFTLIRCSALAKLPKPWFQGEPDEDGDWGTGRVDPDIYFWRKWEKAGNSLHVSTNAKVGHLELMVADSDEDMKPTHTYVREWLESHGQEVKDLMA